LSAGVRQRRQRPFEVVTQLFVLRREAEPLTEVVGILVDGEPRARGRDLEQDATRLAEVDAEEILAIDDRSGSRAEPLEVLAPRLVVLIAVAPGDVMDRTRALEPDGRGRRSS
jgi:hypothetical protein